MRVVVVDLLCNSPYYCAPLTAALNDAGTRAELASPRFYPEPQFLDPYPRSRWIVDLAVHASRPRALRVAVRAIEAPLNLIRLLARIRSRAYDVVHVQWVPLEERSSRFMRLLRSACDATGTALVLTAHNAVPHDREVPDRATLRRSLDAAHLVVAQTDHVARELVQDLGTSAPVAVIPHGPLFVDRQLPPRAEAAARLGRPSPPVVLFLGLIRPYKGLDLLAEAWPEVRAAFPKATLFVVGKVADRGAAADLVRLQAQAGVRLIDRYVPVDEMLDYHAASDVVVFPYRRISQSGALMTAAGLGRPTVVTPIDGLVDQVRDLGSAVVAEAVTGPAMAAALLASLRAGDEMRGAAERDRASIAASPSGWASVARSTVLAYRDVLAARREARRTAPFGPPASVAATDASITQVPSRPKERRG